MLLWLDLETTGLDADRDHVLEIAAIVTDDQFREQATFGRFQAVSSKAGEVVFCRLHPAVKQMHTENGLWMESLHSSDSVNTLDQRLASYIEQACQVDPIAKAKEGDKVGPILAGNTISFDRAFMRKHLPLSFSLLHYRNLDVTSLSEIAKRFWPDVFAGRPKPNEVGPAAHRAMADVLNSLETARYYSGALLDKQRTLQEAHDIGYRFGEIRAFAKSLYGKLRAYNATARNEDELAKRLLDDAMPPEDCEPCLAMPGRYAEGIYR